jgi:hypothetical protein
MFVAMYRKPEDGCKIQNYACGCTGIMLQLNLVKTSQEEINQEEDGNNDHLNHVTRILLQLVKPWNNTNRVLCSDSNPNCKESLTSLIEIYQKCKNSKKRIPHGVRPGKGACGEKGTRFGIVSTDAENIPQLPALVWNKRERRYFISLTSSSQEVQPQVCHCWRHLVANLTTPPTCIEVVVPQTANTEI